VTDVRPFSFVDTLAGGGLTDKATSFILNELSDVGIAAPCNLTAGPAYLRSITVEGFRGIGREAKLPLNPGVGLTVVVGANGSGKSSFAEAVERLHAPKARNGCALVTVDHR
jgi:ABC-type transport system involved in cytochrome bd biosynthesis fused ATPase/permease subunit